MEQVEREMAVDSLTHLESYYQSRYEYYLAMATEAKEHRERVGLLLQDLLRVENYRVESSSISERRVKLARTHARETRAGSLVNGVNLELSSLGESKVEKSNASESAEQMKRFLEEISLAMSVIKSIVDADSGKTLHTSYLHQRLNLELERELSVELVELYLEEAVTRGYLEQDEFDRSCYRARSTDLEAQGDRLAVAVDKQNEDVDVVSETVLNRRTSPNVSSSKKPYELPPSSKLKPTLLETISHYIARHHPKRFSIDDIANYLYSSKEQSDWSQGTRNKVRTCISNVLGRKAYLGKYWSRVQPGVYRPLTI